MFHGTLTLITKLRPEAVEDARHTLEELARAIQSRQPHPFLQIEEIYFAHWGIGGDEAQDTSASESSEERCLIFGADLRLTDSLRGRAQRRAAVKLLVERLAQQPPERTRSFDALYGHCEGYPSLGLRAPDQVEQYLLAHAVPYNTRHIDFAYRVSPVADIRGLVALRARVEDFLNERRRASWVKQVGVGSVRETLREQLAATLSRVKGLAWQRSLRAALRTAALATLTYLPLDAPLRLILQLKNRLTRPARTLEHVTVPDSVRERIEARQGPVQNSMILVTGVPERWTGRLRQRFFMALVNWRLLRNVVGLNDMRTIHIARWALFQRGSRRQLLFMVTYDESWEAYVDTFVDHEDMSTFLKLIWKDTKGFPSGLPFVEPFKQWIRGVQCPIQVHYSAFLHGGEQPHPFALTDLHEFSELRQVLATDGPRGPEDEADQRALGAFLEQGRFPSQDKLLSPWRSLRLLCEQLLTPLRPSLARPSLPRPSFPASRSVTHVTEA